MLKYFITLAIFLSPIAATACSVNKFVIGVGTHLTYDNKPIKLSINKLVEAGVMSFRDDARWEQVETRKGHLTIPESWDRLINLANKQGICPLLILDYGNHFYSNGRKPLSPRTLVAFKHYAEFVADHFRGQVKGYEIWNEWDSSTGNTTPGNAEDYIRLVRVVYPAIKRVDKHAQVLVGAVTASGIRNGFLKRIVQLGVMKYADALSLHTYLHCQHNSRPEDWAAWMLDVERQLIHATGKIVPFYITEMGWPTYFGKCGIEENKQAEYLARLYLLSRMLPFIKGIWWYDFQDDGKVTSDKQDHYDLLQNDKIKVFLHRILQNILYLFNDKHSTIRQQHFGLLRSNMSEKPAYQAIQGIISLFNDTSFKNRINLESEGLYALQFSNNKKQLLVLWSDKPEQCFILKLDENNMTSLQSIKYIQGGIKVRSENQLNEIGVSDNPIILQWPVGTFLDTSRVKITKLSCFNKIE